MENKTHIVTHVIILIQTSVNFTKSDVKLSQTMQHNIYKMSFSIFYDLFFILQKYLPFILLLYIFCVLISEVYF